MKKLLMGLLFTASLAALAKPTCWVNNANGEHFDFTIDESVDTGAPYGTVKLFKNHQTRGYYYVSLTNQETGISELMSIKGKYLSISTVDKSSGERVDTNLVCSPR